MLTVQFLQDQSGLDMVVVMGISNHKQVTDTFNITVNDVSTGVSETRITQLEIYPNPVTDYLKFNVKNIEGSGWLRLFNAQGKEVLRQEIHNFEQLNGSPWSVQQLPPGIYSYRLRNQHVALSGKLVKTN